MLSITELKEKINHYMNWENDNKKINSFLKVFDVDLKELYKLIKNDLEQEDLEDIYTSFYYKKWEINITRNDFITELTLEDIINKVIVKFVKAVINKAEGVNLFIYV